MNKIKIVIMKIILIENYKNLSKNAACIYWKVGWLVFMAYQPLLVINAKSIFMQIVSSISNNSV